MSLELTLAYVLILIGAALFVLEFFILVSGSILFAVGIVLMGIGIALTFNYGSTPAVGFATLIGVFVVLPMVIAGLLRIFPKSVRQRIFLRGPDADATIAAMPVHLELEALRGRYGRTVSALRPAGAVDFDGKRIDCLSEGMLIEPGQWVRCVDVKPGRVIVRTASPPGLKDLEDMSVG